MRASLTVLIATMALMFTIAAMPISPSGPLAEREIEYDLDDFDFDCNDSDSDLDLDVEVKYPDFKECDEFDFSDCLDDPPRFSVQSNSPHGESIPKVEDSWDAPQSHFVSSDGHARVNAGCAVLSPGWCLKCPGEDPSGICCPVGPPYDCNLCCSFPI